MMIEMNEQTLRSTDISGGRNYSLQIGEAGSGGCSMSKGTSKFKVASGIPRYFGGPGGVGIGVHRVDRYKNLLSTMEYAELDDNGS